MAAATEGPAAVAMGLGLGRAVEKGRSIRGALAAWIATEPPTAGKRPPTLDTAEMYHHTQRKTTELTRTVEGRILVGTGCTTAAAGTPVRAADDGGGATAVET